MFVITGATGHTGSVAAETLLAAGKPVRVVVRDANKAKALAERGAEVVVAELSDEAALTQPYATRKARSCSRRPTWAPRISWPRARR